MQQIVYNVYGAKIVIVMSILKTKKVIVMRALAEFYA
jgi:hypothetical protein